jgi:hypothetical protein
MTPYKAFAVYLKSQASSLNATFYPTQAPQNVAKPYGIFTVVEDAPQVTHDGGFDDGLLVMQIDLYADTLSSMDTLVDGIKTIFIGQSVALDSTVKMAYCDSSNEMDEFDSEQKLYIRSFDLNIKYIIT